MTKDEARKKIQELVALAKSNLEAATALADEHQEGFNWQLAYGMGGYYTPKRPPQMTKDEALSLIRSGANLTAEQREKIAETLDNATDTSDWQESYYDEEGWNSSSQNC